jgi:hypothetical protein
MHAANGQHLAVDEPPAAARKRAADYLRGLVEAFDQEGQSPLGLVRYSERITGAASALGAVGLLSDDEVADALGSAQKRAQGGRGGDQPAEMPSLYWAGFLKLSVPPAEQVIMISALAWREQVSVGYAVPAGAQRAVLELSDNMNGLYTIVGEGMFSSKHLDLVWSHHAPGIDAKVDHPLQVRARFEGSVSAWAPFTLTQPPM